MMSPGKEAETLIGLEVFLDGIGAGWVQEASGAELIIGIYPDGNETRVPVKDISEILRYGPPLPTPNGFIAVDLAGSGGAWLSLRLSESEHKKMSRAAASLDQSFEDFFLQSLIAGAESALKTA